MAERRTRDAALTVAVTLCAAVLVAGQAALLADVVRRGLSGVNLSYLTTASLDAGRGGGVAPVLVATGLVLAVCLSVAVPLALLTAILLADAGANRRPARTVRRSLDVLAAVPSIVFGLFGAALFGRVLGLGFSILSGGLTLACMVLPLLIRTTEVGISSLPASYGQAAAALGLSRSTTLLRLLLPAAAPAIGVGLTLGIGRALAETAALIFTSGYVARMPGSLLDSGRTLSVHIYDLAMNVPGGDRNAYASALVLVAVLAVINGAAGMASERLLGRRSTR